MKEGHSQQNIDMVQIPAGKIIFSVPEEALKVDIVKKNSMKGKNLRFDLKALAKTNAKK
jgi:hypothetical protein